MTKLTEKELFEKCPDVIGRYTPFVLLSVEQGNVIDESYRNNHKYEMRGKRCRIVNDVLNQIGRKIKLSAK